MANEQKEWWGTHTHCYGMMPLPKSGELRPLMVTEPLDPLYKTIQCTMYTKTGNGRIVVCAIDDLMTKGIWYIPECKMFNGSRAAVYYKLDPIRQYYKGLREFGGARWIHGNVAFDPPFGIEVELAWGWLTHYPNYEEALERVLTGNMLSCAFDKYWAVSAMARSNYPVLYHREDPVGRVELESNTIYLPKSYYLFNEYLNAITHRKIVNE